MSAVPYVPPVSPASNQYLVPSTGCRVANVGEDEPLDTKIAVDAANSAEKHGPPYIYRYPMQVMGKQILVETALVGRHQLRNVALAIATAKELSDRGSSGIRADSIERGIRETCWPGRFQVIPARAGAPEIVMDVAHNPAGAWALRSALSAQYEDRPLIFVFGAMRDKAISEMAQILFPLAEQVIAVQAENPRSASPEEIREAAKRSSTEIETAENVASALDRARALSKPETVVVITGSIYVVGEAMRSLGAKV
jgi:dihydrofolate synthase/folylpolyglutamate synthase